LDFSEGDLLEVIDAAYASAADRARWPAFLDRLSHKVGGPATIYRWSKAAPDDNRPLIDNFGEAGRDYEAHYRHHNVWVTDAANLREAIIPSEQITRLDDLERTEFYNDWLRPQGLKHGVSCQLSDRHGLSYSLGLIRAPARGEFGAGDLRFLTAAMPHVQRALELGHQLERLERQAGGALEAFTALGMGALTVDRLGRVVYANAAADRLLAATPALSLRSGRLGAVREALDAPLRGAIAAATGQGRRLRGRTGAVLAIPRLDAPPLTLSVLPLQDEDRPGPEHEPLALLILNDPQQSAGGSQEALSAVYGLTAAEAALAAALLGGETLAAYARRVGLALPTVKTQLASVFAKVGVNRQADLMRVLAANPALSVRN